MKKTNTFENSQVTNLIEKFFVNKRAYTISIPKPGSSVVLLVSGGLDSILTWGLLLIKYKVKVYPLYLRKGEKRASKEESAVDYFSKYYSQRFPKLFVKPQKHSIFLPQKELIAQLKTPFDNLLSYDQNTISGFNPYTTTNIFLGSPGIVPFYAMLFARHIELTSKIKLRTIYSSVTMGDGEVCPSQTLSSLRTINLAMCTFTGDFTWQFTSPLIDPQFNLYYKKRDLIIFGANFGIPTVHTWSCYRGMKHQCGVCLACVSRKLEFQHSGIQDNTRYVKNENVVFYVAKFIKVLYRKMKLI